MNIEAVRTGKSSVEMFLSGRLDTSSAPQFERKIRQWGDDITEIILDFADLTYISSMGLRVLLQTQKAMTEKSRRLSIKNMGEAVREVFEMTGFVNLLVQEEKFVVIRKDESGCRIRLSLIGQMDAANIPPLEQELIQIRDAGQLKTEETTVILDAEKLGFISASGCRLLKQTLLDTSWSARRISIENAPESIATVFEGAGLYGLRGAES